ncbi:hypothetical protein PG994_006759 [Apiospora phragmitis]|uniref:Uncharacterized protein n=1 Tax=Apiospora phragmitis TaxID=2905665 RepID=A0ABR1VJV3_9PEZI
MENISTSTLTTVGGWAVIIGVGGLIYYRAQTKAGRRQPANKSSSLHAKVPTGEYEKNVASAATATKKKAEKALKPKSKPAAPVTATTDTAKTTGADYDPEAEAAANRRANDEFARQYASAKSGTKFEAAKRDDKKAKSVKQSRAREIEVPDDKVSVPSSTTGDADDDLSETNSPEVVAADSRDVSDMLEQTSPGPSVMRITDTENVKAKQKKEKKAEVVESKKQRQNRKKAEAAKAARLEEEQERKKLEEAQRRQARIAEGRAAKDGSAYTTAAAKESVWKPKPADEDSGKLVELLDTEEQKPAAKAANSANSSTPKPAASNNSKDSWMSAVPSEEEQMKLLQDEDSWNEVTTKKSKKGKKTTDSSANAASTENVAATATPAAAPPAKAPVNGNSKSTKPALSSSSSFAALTPDETTDDNEIEEEWEV